MTTETTAIGTATTENTTCRPSAASPRRALIVCDLQIATLNSISNTSERRALVDLIRILVESIRSYNNHNHITSRGRDGNRDDANYDDGRQIKIIWSGLSFSSTEGDPYSHLSENHRILGSLKRLNRITQGKSKFFVEGEPTTDFAIQPMNDNEDEEECVVWRSSMLPDFHSQKWQELLEGVTDVTVVGLKTSFAVQSAVQGLWDASSSSSITSLQKVSVVQECTLDDDMDRHASLMKHMIPIYADVVTLAEWVKDQIIQFEENVSGAESKIQSVPLDPTLRYCCDCGRGGHAYIYQQHLLRYRNGWANYPLQDWFTAANRSGLGMFVECGGKSYKCPLGKRVIDFCDEPRFSKCSMYVKGREWLDEKEKLWSMLSEYGLGDLMPKTYLIQRRQWVDPDSILLQDTKTEKPVGPFFVKDCQKNGGKAVQVCSKIEDALQFVDNDSYFVVQQHISDPYLTNDGRKCHIKSYFLLTEDNHGNWELRMYPEAFLSQSPNVWSQLDLSPETQITVKRNKRLYKRRPEPKFDCWPSAHRSIRKIVCQVVETAISKGKLQSRNSKVSTTGSSVDNKNDEVPSPSETTTTRQFEIFSADVIFDEDERPWLIECNFGCVLYDPNINQPLTTIGLRTYQRLCEDHGADKVEVNDHEMIADAMDIVFGSFVTTGMTGSLPNGVGEVSKFELVGTYQYDA
mmetsp:Transcript_12402/g.29803  ORF Transcript_12402/g.29803 Transcript_12402/m.29803 type:complete len:689 (-) Transcript_12402:221-2287(-)